MIKSVKLTNFQSHKETKLELHSKVNCIVGTSDSGKTAILRAIRWLWLNRPGGTALVRTGTEQAEVELVVLDIAGKPDILKRIRSVKGANEYWFNDQPFKTVGRDVPLEITHALRLQDINMQSQLDQPFLVFETPGQIAAILNKYTSLDEGEELAHQIALDIRRRKQSIEMIEADINSLTLDIEGYSWLEDCEKRVEHYDEVCELIEFGDKLKKDLSSLIDVIIENSIVMVRLIIKINNATEFHNQLKDKVVQLDTLSNVAEVLSKDRDVLVSLIEDIRNNKRELSKTICEHDKLNQCIDIVNKLKELKLQIVEKEDKLDVIDYVIVEFEKQEDWLGRCNQRIKKENTDLKTLKECLGKQKECPYCGSELTNKTRDNLIKSLK